MIETLRTIMRPHSLADAHDLFLLNQDPEVTRFTGDDGTKTVIDAQKIITERMIPQWEKHQMGRFHVALKDGTYIGWCGLRFFPEHNEVDLGYRFKKKYWGQGLATECSRACLEYGFLTLNLEKIIAKAVPDNVASIKVMQKLGMTFTGHRSEPGDPHPHVIYELRKKDFRP